VVHLDGSGFRTGAQAEPVGAAGVTDETNRGVAAGVGQAGRLDAADRADDDATAAPGASFLVDGDPASPSHPLHLIPLPGMTASDGSRSRCDPGGGISLINNPFRPDKAHFVPQPGSPKIRAGGRFRRFRSPGRRSDHAEPRNRGRPLGANRTGGAREHGLRAGLPEPLLPGPFRNPQSRQRMAPGAWILRPGPFESPEPGLERVMSQPGSFIPPEGPGTPHHRGRFSRRSGRTLALVDRRKAFHAVSRWSNRAVRHLTRE